MTRGSTAVLAFHVDPFLGSWKKSLCLLVIHLFVGLISFICLVDALCYIFYVHIYITQFTHTHNIYILYHIFSCMFLYLTVGIDTTRVWWEPPSTSRDEAEAPHLCLVGHRQVPRCSPNHGIWEGDLWPVRFLLWFFVSSYFDQKEDLKWVMIFLPVGQLWSKKWSKFET